MLASLAGSGIGESKLIAWKEGYTLQTRPCLLCSQGTSPISRVTNQLYKRPFHSLTHSPLYSCSLHPGKSVFDEFIANFTRNSGITDAFCWVKRTSCFVTLGGLSGVWFFESLDILFICSCFCNTTLPNSIGWVIESFIELGGTQKWHTILSEANL